MNIRFYLQYWRSGVVILAPILLLPLPLLIQTNAARCGYVILVMACYWVSEAVHLAATALIPIFALPLLGILSTNEVCLTYMKDTNMLFLGGLAMAAAVEHSGLHERIALLTLRKIGSSTERLLFGFMMTQMFLSMWISNTAATAMMVPIVEAILLKIQQGEENHRELNAGDEASRTEENQSNKENQHKNKNDYHDVTIDPASLGGESMIKNTENDVHKSVVMARKKSHLDTKSTFKEKHREIIYLGIAYAANIGGTGSLTGTNPNLVLVGFLELWYPEVDTGLNYATWLMFNVPGMLLCTIFSYFWLCLLLLHFNGWKRHHNKEANEAVQRLLDSKYDSLGRISFQEKVVSLLFSLAVALWFFRKPEIITGWGELVEDAVGTKISSATPAMLVVFLMFVAPSSPFWVKNTEGGPKGPSPGCLTWDVFHHKVPWGVIILIGGGFALAEGGRKSELSAWLGAQFSSFADLPKEVTLFIICIMATFLTEVMSNTAASALLLPVLNDMALAMRIHPLYFLLPVTLCTSYAFMLPVATPPNAIVYEAVKTMRISRMISAGFMVNMVCVSIAYAMINSLGNPMFHVQTFPQWANSTDMF